MLENFQKKDDTVVLRLYFDDDLNYSEEILYNDVGFFAHPISAYPGIKQQLNIKVEDSDGFYESNLIEVVIPRRENVVDIYQLGNFQLATKDGKGC